LAANNQEKLMDVSTIQTIAWVLFVVILVILIFRLKGRKKK